MKEKDSAELCPVGCIHLTFKGELDINSLRSVLEKTDVFIEQLKKEGKPVLILANATRLEVIKLDSRKYGVEWLKKKHYEKVAVYGSSIFMKYFVNMLIRVISNNMRYFDSYEKATEWLHE